MKARITFVVLFIVGCSAVGQQRPNVILIMADDLGYGDLGCYGQTRIRTPNIDVLAENGMRFTQYYAGSTVCAPSREVLLTGRHTGHTQIRGNFLTDDREDPALPGSAVTIAELLKEAGYRTGIIGKWGLGGEGNGPTTQGFDYSYGYLDQIQAHNYYPPFLYENDKKVMIDSNSDDREQVYSHHLFFDKTVDFLTNSEPGKPFLLYLPYTIPHGKHVIPDDAPYSAEEWPQSFRNYAAMITLLDRDVGRIVALVKERGLDENTLILFTSDNGANRAFAEFFKSNGPFRGHKTTLYEGGIREPLIAYWPGTIRPGQVSDRITAAWDVAPTVCEIASVPVPASADGVSFRATLLGREQRMEDRYLYWEYYTYNYNWNKPGSTMPRNWLDSRAVRKGKWKAIMKSNHAGVVEPIQLYDLETDPAEKRNVAGENMTITQALFRLMTEASVADAPYFPYRKK